MEMDLAKTYDTPELEKASKEVYYPSLYITSDVPAECPDDVFEAKVKLKKTSMTAREDKEGKTTYSYEFDVHSIELPAKKGDYKSFDEAMSKEFEGPKVVVVELGSE